MTSSTAQDALKAVLREQVDPALRSYGFRGSAPTWILTSASGDRAVVNVQSSDISSSREVLCTLNTSVIPIAWWRWINHNLGKKESRAAKEYDGLWRQRVPARRQQASSRPEWWSVTDTTSAIVQAKISWNGYTTISSTNFNAYSNQAPSLTRQEPVDSATRGTTFAACSPSS